MAKRRTDLSEKYDSLTKTIGAEKKISAPQKEPLKQLSTGRNIAVPLGLIKLDPYQPRHIIPVISGIRDRFFSGENDWSKTAKHWLETTSSDPAINKQVSELLEMGKSIKKLNQIEPATGAWVVTQDGEDKFTLSTGERRFWSLALTAIVDNQKEEPQLVCQEIKLTEMNLERQFVENESSKPLSAIGKARVIAGLIINRVEELPPELDRNSPNPPTDYEYYKSALDLETLMGRKNMPKGTWEEIGEIVGMERKYMANHLNLLKFPEDILYQADVNDIPETVLREALVYSPAQWEKIIPKIIKENLTAAEVKKIRTAKRKKTSPKDNPAAKAANRLRAYWKVTREMSSSKDLEQVATDFAAGLEKKEILKGAESLEKLAKKLRLRAQDQTRVKVEL